MEMKTVSELLVDLSITAKHQAEILDVLYSNQEISSKLSGVVTDNVFQVVPLTSHCIHDSLGSGFWTKQ